ncbi:unnamed protein product [Penicillium olsonii]|uniref:Amine oxidase domain-containing protein n=1 Tax=Penicillium olsonii TaxID=99116 RepID=A0A9W4HDS3_PENOL|nr:unnamed protein product [Penicillium olsonii]CAG7978226.1 unnamed protein product [Penicillium olsonii]
MYILARISEVQSIETNRGPNWIHGAGENPIMNIAEATEAAMFDPDEGGHIAFAPDGQRVPEDVNAQVQDFVWTTISEAFKYSNEHGGKITAEKSLLDFFRDRVQQTDFSDEVRRLCLDACKLWGTYVGDQVDRQSLRFFRLEECVDGSNFVVASTYKRILEHVSKTALAKAEIRLNEPVKTINAPNRTPTTKPTITTTKATYTFDEVVVTCPLGWLKQNTSAFNPPLPPRLQKAITNISYGRLEKVYITFPHAFWHQTEPTISAQFLEPQYAPHPKHIEWNQECLSFAALPSPHAHPTLLFYTYGESGAHIINSIQGLDPLSAEYKDVLTQALHPFYSRLPGYDGSEPTAFLATQWQKDEFAGNGSYCNFQAGVEEADVDIEVLRGDGMGLERGLWFAGEHTAPFVALGTTTGAYWSGERVARGICGGLEGEARDDSSPSAVLRD